MDGWIDGWMDCNFASFSTVHVYQLYQDDGWMIMKGCVQWDPKPVTAEINLPQAGLEPLIPRYSRLVLNPLSYRAPP